MKPTLTVWPDGLWLVVDELGTTIAKGTWCRSFGVVEAFADRRGRPPLCVQRADAAFCGAVVAVVEAMAHLS